MPKVTRDVTGKATLEPRSPDSWPLGPASVSKASPRVVAKKGQPVLTLTSPWSSFPGGISLTSKDPRWVGAWWLGFLVSAGAVALAAVPYFFFPREMPKEKHELRFRRRALAAAASPVSKVSPLHGPTLVQAPAPTYPSSLVTVDFIPPGHCTSQLTKPFCPGSIRCPSNSPAQ